MPKKKRKVFSLEEANKLLPELEKRLKCLQIKKESYARLHDALFMHELVCVAEKSNGFFEKDDLETNIRDLEQAIENLAKDVEAIFSLGCVLRDIEKGRVDFPAHFEGKRLFWSWEQGEPEVRYFRHVQSEPGERILIPKRILKTAKQSFS